MSEVFDSDSLPADSLPGNTTALPGNTTFPPDGNAPLPWLRPLGRTGLTVSAVAAGGAVLGSMPTVFGYDVPQEQAEQLVQRLLSSPIRVIDTANGYSDGESERRIGAGIRLAGGLPAGYLISTKVDATGADYSAPRVRASLAESKERLACEKLPLVHLHDPEFHDVDTLLAPGGAARALAELRESGEVGAIGVAGGEVATMLRFVRSGLFDVLLTHSRLTLLDGSADVLVEEAAKRGMGVMNAAVYGGGILTDTPREAGARHYGYREASGALLAAVQKMREACREFGATLQQAALQFSIQDSRVSCTVVGMGSPERIDETLGAADSTLPDELWQRLRSLRPGAEYWLDASVPRLEAGENHAVAEVVTGS